MLAVDETTSDEPQTLMTQVRSLPPIASENSKILILGSMPGEESLRVGQYYANARNKF
jgi:TDG/mug DNA glycosylase family protein